VCGTIAAFITRIWVIFVTSLLIHSKREKVYAEVYEVVRAKRTVCLNTFRYYLGLVIVLITISKGFYRANFVVICYAQVFAFSGRFTPTLGKSWGWATLFAVISDLMVVDGAFIAVATMLTMTVGAAPDACGKCRNCWLGMVPEAIKDAAH
jgi:hypothetical protein